jgi:hypothetical protein
MQYYNYIIDREVYRCNMLKDTSLIDLKRKDQSPHILALEIIIYLTLEIFVRLILEVFVRQL